MTQQDPIQRFQQLFGEAVRSEPFDASRAALATTGSDGVPQVRFVLVKLIDRGLFVVFTNLQSPKARAMQQHPRAALAFHWASTGVQVRIAGGVHQVSDQVADAYFRSRPRGSQLGAWASAQSEVLESRQVLMDALAEHEARFRGEVVPRPPFWGGFQIEPSRIEFWHNRDDRLHDRFLYERQGDGYRVSRLSP